MEDTVESRVKKVIGEITGRAPETIADGDNLTGELRVDSLGLVELVLMLETEFDINLDEADFDGLHTVGDVVKYVGGKVNG